MRSLRLLLTAAVLLARGGLPSAADEPKENRANRRAVLTQLHSRYTLDRAEAVRRLADFPPLEGAKLVMQSGLGDPEQEVRHAAYETLLTWKDEREVGNFLVKGLEKDLRAKGGPTAATPLLAVLLASELPDTQRRVDKFLETSLAKSRDGAFILGGVADELGLQGDRSALPALRRLAGLKCVSETFACRRAVIQAIIRMRRPESVAALIALLPGLDGEVRGDVVRHLEEISGQRHGTDVKLWQAWWKEHADSFEFPTTPAMVQGGEGAPGPQAAPSYYGISIYARRLLFVIDTSGSMTGQRIQTAKRELISAIKALPNDAELGILVFNTQVTVWRPALIPATAAAKQEAVYFVNNLAASGRTAAYDALDRAFHFDPEAIYFLSDGEPTCGKIVSPEGILAAVHTGNRNRRISIYSIGIAPGAPGSRLELFMKTLAEQNFGQFRRVDQ